MFPRKTLTWAAPVAHASAVVIVETRIFTRQILELLDDVDYRALQLELHERPTAGAVIQGSGGLRKLRWSASGRGKRGGLRVIYLWRPEVAKLLMLYAYPKSEKDDLTAMQLQALRRVVEREFP